MAELSRASPQSSSTSASPAHDGNGTTNGGHWLPPQAGSLAATYPVNTLMEIKVAPTGNIIRGVIYCTDEFSNSIVVKRALVHTTTSCEITIINADSVMECKAIDFTSDEAKELVGGVTGIDELKLPLPNVSKKALEEREKRAIRLAEESFGHINQKVMFNLYIVVIFLCMFTTFTECYLFWSENVYQCVWRMGPLCLTLLCIHLTINLHTLSLSHCYRHLQRGRKYLTNY